MRPAEVLRIGTPAISSFNRGTGSTEVGEIVFETAILSILEFYGAQWRSMQITELAQMMHSKHYWLHVAELKHFTLLAKAGEYNRKETRKRSDLDGQYLGTEEYDGKIYGQLSPAVLSKWFEEYAGESLLHRGQLRIEQERAPKPEELREGDVGPERISEALRGFVEAFRQPGDEGVPDEEKEAIYRQEKNKQAAREALRNNTPQP